MTVVEPVSPPSRPNWCLGVGDLLEAIKLHTKCTWSSPACLLVVSVGKAWPSHHFIDD